MNEVEKQQAKKAQKAVKLIREATDFLGDDEDGPVTWYLTEDEFGRLQRDAARIRFMVEDEQIRRIRVAAAKP